MGEAAGPTAGGSPLRFFCFRPSDPYFCKQGTNGYATIVRYTCLLAKAASSGKPLQRIDENYAGHVLAATVDAYPPSLDAMTRASQTLAVVFSPGVLGELHWDSTSPFIKS